MYSLVVLFAVLPARICASSVSAASTAQAWLQTHAGAPNELSELKGANPEAFAIVQALLTKRSLGLLDPKHPTASFSKRSVDNEPRVRAPVVVPAVVEEATPAAKPQIELPYANVKSKHHDWLNWKPHSTAADDAMVGNVLGMVGGLGSGRVPAEASARAEGPPEVADRQPAGMVVAESPPKATSDWGNIGSMLGLHKKLRRTAAPPVASEGALRMESSEASPSQEVEQTAVRKPRKQDWNSMEKMKQNSDDKAVTNLLNMVAQLKGKKAEKLLAKHRIINSEENALSHDAAAFGENPEEASAGASMAADGSNANDVPAVAPPALAETSAPVALATNVPVATPPLRESSQPKQDSWGDIGGMLGVRPKPKPKKTMTSVAYESQPDGAMPAEIRSLVTGHYQPPRRAAPQSQQSDDYAREMKKKQNADDTAVNRILSMVASLKGSKKAAQLADKYSQGTNEENPLLNDAGSFGAAEAPAQEAAGETTQVEEAPEAARPLPKKRNRFLDSLTSSVAAPQKQRRHDAALAKENSYLKEFDLTSDSKDRTASRASSSKLRQEFASSSSNGIMASWFSDSTAEKPVRHEKSPTMRKAGKLLSWLGTEEQPPRQAVSVTTAAPAPVNRYLADLD